MKNTKSENIIIERFLNNDISLIKLNRPRAKNALNLELIYDLVSALKSESKLCKVILLTGSGNVFCAGGDVKNMKSGSGMFAGNSFELKEQYEQGIQQIPLAIEEIDIPVIALVNGAAIGAGCDLSCMCDIRIASENAFFCENFSQLNLVPADGGTFFMQRVLGYSKTLELMLTAKRVLAKEALAIGLVNHIVDTSTESSTNKSISTSIDEKNLILLEYGIKMAKEISKNSLPALKLTKKALKMAGNNSLQDNLSLLSAYQGICQRMLEHKVCLNNIK